MNGDYIFTFNSFVVSIHLQATNFLHINPFINKNLTPKVKATSRLYGNCYQKYHETIFQFSRRLLMELLLTVLKMGHFQTENWSLILPVIIFVFVIFELSLKNIQRGGQSEKQAREQFEEIVI